MQKHTILPSDKLNQLNKKNKIKKINHNSFLACLWFYLTLTPSFQCFPQQTKSSFSVPLDVLSIFAIIHSNIYLSHCGKKP